MTAYKVIVFVGANQTQGLQEAVASGGHMLQLQLAVRDLVKPKLINFVVHQVFLSRCIPSGEIR